MRYHSKGIGGHLPHTSCEYAENNMKGTYYQTPRLVVHSISSGGRLRVFPLTTCRYWLHEIRQMELSTSF